MGKNDNPATVRRDCMDPLSRESIAERIRQHRFSETTLRIINSSGQPVVHVKITVEMVRHKFLFGCNAIPLAVVETIP